MSESDNISRNVFQEALVKRKQRDDLQIMIVEDQKFSRLMLKNLLAKSYAVLAAVTGEDALKAYVAEAPDIVFLDIELPGTDGHKVCSLLTRLDKDAFVVMVTANSYKEDVEKAKTGGAKGFVIKPYTRDKIYAYIDQFIQERTLGSHI